jgi:hypothetical protein
MIRRLWLRLRHAARLRGFLKWSLASLFVATLLLLSPVAYVELRCRGDAATHAYAPLLTDPAFQRREANTYLTYPEWHIVFAYDGLAEVLKTGDEHAFDYVSSISRFWGSACALTRVAGQHGGADWGTRSMIHTIGVSFTMEMLAKAAYEETVGRATAWLRGPQKSAQDRFIAAVARDYAAFLRQTPWYRYPFPEKARELWGPPARLSLRGWERRLGIGTEFEVKSVYAKVIERAVAATGEAQLVIRSVVSGLDAAALARIPGVTVIGPRADGFEIETPRYDVFTKILVEIARQGGAIREIAGNDEIMVSLTVPGGAPEGQPVPVPYGTVIFRMKRDGFPGERLLVNVKMAQLSAFLTTFHIGDPGLEHVFDY